jgi:hypothetical protein
VSANCPPSLRLCYASFFDLITPGILLLERFLKKTYFHQTLRISISLNCSFFLKKKK